MLLHVRTRPPKVSEEESLGIDEAAFIDWMHLLSRNQQWWLVRWLVLIGTFNTNRLHRATGVWNILCSV